MADAGRMAHFAQGLGFDLPNAFAGDTELLAHFLQRAGKAIAQAEAQFEHPSLALGQPGEHIRELILEEAETRYLRRAFSGFILNEITKTRIIAVSHRRLEGNRLLGHL